MHRSRLIWRLVAVCATIVASLAVMAPSASASIAMCPLVPTETSTIPACNLQHKVFINGSYKGWAYVYGRSDCPALAQCIVAGEPTITAWRWSNGAWSRSSFNRNEQVYAWPYGGGWQWAWTQRTGWLAIQTSRLYTWQLNPLEAAAN